MFVKGHNLCWYFVGGSFFMFVCKITIKKGSKWLASCELFYFFKFWLCVCVDFVVRLCMSFRCELLSSCHEGE